MCVCVPQLSLLFSSSPFPFHHSFYPYLPTPPYSAQFCPALPFTNYTSTYYYYYVLCALYLSFSLPLFFFPSLFILSLSKRANTPRIFFFFHTIPPPSPPLLPCVLALPFYCLIIVPSSLHTQKRFNTTQKREEIFFSLLLCVIHRPLADFTRLPHTSLSALSHRHLFSFTPLFSFYFGASLSPSLITPSHTHGKRLALLHSTHTTNTHIPIPPTDRLTSLCPSVLTSFRLCFYRTLS